ncbi:unnamed protein product [Chondrus crispus]|uniref:Secreted protein n=1 Tax=Chondrus crispus TaxID=2769 RepID=R7QB20_CHOCR|nr:unnamed protein product [Chondrus crispus]CDF35269.1 unnamed protein product [Chondrus crispus]|eukprot:XP_005715088.1 unnamed protein product [Chondrus crispus]
MPSCMSTAVAWAPRLILWGCIAKYPPSPTVSPTCPSSLLVVPKGTVCANLARKNLHAAVTSTNTPCQHKLVPSLLPAFLKDTPCHRPVCPHLPSLPAPHAEQSPSPYDTRSRLRKVLHAPATESACDTVS